MILKEVGDGLTYLTPNRSGVSHITSPHYCVDAADETVLEKPEDYCDGGDVTNSNLSGERDKHQDRGDKCQNRKFGVT
jgi:hypothetical protein